MVKIQDYMRSERTVDASTKIWVWFLDSRLHQNLLYENGQWEVCCPGFEDLTVKVQEFSYSPNCISFFPYPLKGPIVSSISRLQCIADMTIQNVEVFWERKLHRTRHHMTAAELLQIYKPYIRILVLHTRLQVFHKDESLLTWKSKGSFGLGFLWAQNRTPRSLKEGLYKTLTAPWVRSPIHKIAAIGMSYKWPKEIAVYLRRKYVRCIAYLRKTQGKTKWNFFPSVERYNSEISWIFFSEETLQTCVPFLMRTLRPKEIIT